MIGQPLVLFSTSFGPSAQTCLLYDATRRGRQMCGRIFRLNRTKKPELFISIFIAASYLVMCNIKYGMNLRYANMWDMPLRFLAFSEIVWLASFAKRSRAAILATAVVLLCAIEFHQYIVLAVHYPLYELITHDLLEALHILKSM